MDIRKMIYNQMRTAVNQKASKNLGQKFDVKKIELNAFFEKDLVFITASDGEKKDTQKLKLSENSEQVDMFIGKISEAINDLHEKKTCTLTLTFQDNVERIELLYADKTGKEKKFIHSEKF